MDKLNMHKDKFTFVISQSFSFILMILVLFSCTKKTSVNPEITLVEELPLLDERIKAAVPHVYINIDDQQEVVDKEVYLNAEIYMEGNGKFKDFEKMKTKIKGRGNSTWSKAKKPFRLKLDKKSSLFNLPEAKDWVLLANYNDYTLMTNAVAMKIGKQLGMPYTHDIISVDLTINGVYRGNYNVTQQVEIHENRVHVGPNGILWELDTYFDEEWKYKTKHFNLPVMLKDPDPESEFQFETWKVDFQNFENLLHAKEFPKNSYGNIFDKQQFVNFLIVNMLVANHEICHPKSVYIHKKSGGIFTMGPIWDFDFSFGFNEKRERTYFHDVGLDLIRESDHRIGAEFYKKILKDAEVRVLLNRTWQTYKNNKFNELMQFIDVFAAEIRDSQKRDFEKWKVGNNNMALNKANMKTFLRKRTKVVDDYIAKL
ncbi:CotH kinase family protein [Sphingobacterium faecium]|uniref:CotH kinase family protein n=1 Tax=Sphingobacterium faecium TaxID=34087 RepID=UPI000D4F087C|nr:CotH kinase family protein [Sphingobacterium faecium]PTX12618.1 CotH protein [Sphingobacterium faecium]